MVGLGAWVRGVNSSDDDDEDEEEEEEEGEVGGDELVFDMEIGSQPGGSPSRGGDKEEDADGALRRLLAACEPKDSFAAQLMFDLARLRGDGRIDRLDPETVGATLASIGYTVHVRRTVGRLCGSRCKACGPAAVAAVFENLRHSFLAVVGPRRDVIVDPAFRDQFAIATPSARYGRMLETLPEVFVGSAGDLLRTLDVVCGEARAAFAAAGMTVPPWRRKKSVASKWLSKSVRTEEIDATGRKKDASGHKVRRVLEPRTGRDALREGALQPSGCQPMKLKAAGVPGRLIVVELKASNAA